MRGIPLIFILLARAFSAPVGIKIDKKGAERVSVKETQNLEQQLKAQAGEDKKFYPSEIQKEEKFVPPHQKIDGLESQHLENAAFNNQIKDDLDLEREIQEDQDVEKEIQAVPSQFDLAEHDEREAENMNEGRNMASPDHINIHEADAGSQVPNDFINERHMGDDEEEEKNEEMGREGKEKDDDDEEEALFMQSVVQAFRERPELMEQFLQAQPLDENKHRNDIMIPRDEDEADRDDVVKAELMSENGSRGPYEGYYNSKNTGIENYRRPPAAYYENQANNEHPTLYDAKQRYLQQLQDEREGELAQQQQQQRQQPSLEDYQKYDGDRTARIVKKGYNTYALRHESSEEEKEDLHGYNWRKHLKDSDESKESESKSKESESKSKESESNSKVSESNSKENEIRSNDIDEASKEYNYGKHIDKSSEEKSDESQQYNYRKHKDNSSESSDTSSESSDSSDLSKEINSTKNSNSKENSSEENESSSSEDHEEENKSAPKREKIPDMSRHWAM